MTPDWTTVICPRCNGERWINVDLPSEKQCTKCAGHGKLVTSIGGEPIMPELKVIASYLLDHWTIISGVLVGSISGVATGNWSAFWSAVAVGITAHIGTPKAVAFSAHLKRRS